LQVLCPPGQAQFPLKHVVPAGQTVPHAPQFDGSSFVFTHARLHSTRPLAQVTAHWPSEQTSPMAHAVPQVPQLAGSLETSTHALPHWVAPVRHPLQAPEVQAVRAGHAVPQAPQFATSLEVSTQVPLQACWAPQSATGVKRHAVRHRQKRANART
jgi:hypothetical protein